MKKEGTDKTNLQETEQREINTEITPELQKILLEIKEKIENSHKKFIEYLTINPSVPDEDKDTLIDSRHSPIKMNNLLPNVRAFVARYIVQMCESDPSNMGEKIFSFMASDIDRILKEGYERYLKIYEVDIPLYDKLYEEFDNWREAGRYPTEVYLGRDGIYAYLGRHAQDSARKSKIGKEGKEDLKKRGEIFEINPKYLVYPRYFRDNIDYDTKKSFLEQERIYPEVDPMGYDTGYTGTIPEQIMKIMNIENPEERIKLLSAPTAKRRVKGISENARGEIIEYIEHNAKLEETADGLFVDEKTGKIRHTAKPANPEDQFYFKMIKQAIIRHYVIKEKLHFEMSENTNLDSENYYMRIRRDYVDLLPKSFIENPKEFFKQEGKLLKGGKGEGEFPDEEVVSFKLNNEVEIIAKKIEIKKAKEAKKEYMILISSQKAGLPTAEPVGFLTGKQEKDGSYLLMEKIEGFSGRKFVTYLKESGKYNDEQINGIMETITTKLEELASLFREKLNIDKRWRIKDTIIQFNENTGEVENVVPIDWERVKTYDPNNPQKIDSV